MQQSVRQDKLDKFGKTVMLRPDLASEHEFASMMMSDSEIG
jgi:hypothetical protein